MEKHGRAWHGIAWKVGEAERRRTEVWRRWRRVESGFFLPS